MFLAGVRVCPEVRVVMPSLEVLMDANHLVDVGPDKRLDHLRSDCRMIRHTDGLAHVVHQRSEDDLIVGTGAFGQRGGLQAMGELVGAEAVSDLCERFQQHQHSISDPTLILSGAGTDLHPLLNRGLIHARE